MWRYYTSVNTSQPVAVMRMVCSIWTAMELSAVTMVQLSGRVLILPEPIVKIGSIARVVPAFSSGPFLELSLWFRT